MLAGAAAGVVLRRSLPTHHLNEHSKDVIRLGFALIATLSALVLGLLITSAKNAYDTSATKSGRSRRSWSCSTTNSSATDRRRGPRVTCSDRR